MMSIRQVARLMPRASSKIFAPVGRSTFTALSRPLPLAKISRVFPVCKASFSTIVPRYEQAGSIDHELSAKLESEIQMEDEATVRDGAANDELPPHLKTYLDQNAWELNDTDGSEEVIMTRKFGKENIKVVFSIADISDFEHDADAYAEDPAMYDDGAAGDVQQDGAQSKSATNQGRDDHSAAAPQEANQEGLGEEEEDSAVSPSPEGFPARLQVTITKDGVDGALYIESLVRDGEIITENVHYFPNAELADAKTAEQDWARRTLYTGPPFGNLDEDLQALIDQYIAERGIDTALALWVPEYMDYKEQREYVDWLYNTKGFIDS